MGTNLRAHITNVKSIHSLCSYPFAAHFTYITRYCTSSNADLPSHSRLIRSPLPLYLHKENSLHRRPPTAPSPCFLLPCSGTKPSVMAARPVNLADAGHGPSESGLRRRRARGSFMGRRCRAAGSLRSGVVRELGCCVIAWVGSVCLHYRWQTERASG